MMELEEKLLFYGIRNYNINEDGSVDVEGDVNLSKLNLFELPFTFRKVTGNFICSYNNITTLKGAPTHVGLDFYCEITI